MIKASVRSAVFSLLCALPCLAQEPAAGAAGEEAGWQDRIYFSLAFKSIPFKFNTQGFDAVYNDGVDDYDLSFDTLDLASAGQISLLINSELTRKGAFRSDAELGLSFITASELYGGHVDLRTLNGFMLGRKVFLASRLALGGGMVRGAVSKVTRGNVSGADFMLGPKGERIPEGNEISMSAFMATVSGGLGLQIDLFARVFADIFTDYVVYGSAGDWELVATDDGGKDVTLERKNFSNIADLQDVDLGGLSFGLSLGWRL